MLIVAAEATPQLPKVQAAPTASTASLYFIWFMTNSLTLQSSATAELLDYTLGTHENSIGSIKNDIEIGTSLYRSVTKPRFTEVNYSSRFYGTFAGLGGRLEPVWKGIFNVYEEYVFPPR